MPRRGLRGRILERDTARAVSLFCVGLEVDAHDDLHHASAVIRGLARILVCRFSLDPRDARGDGDFYELVGDDDGVFGCMTLLGCQDVCPKQLPLQTQIAFLRRRMARAGA